MTPSNSQSARPTPLLVNAAKPRTLVQIMDFVPRASRSLDVFLLSLTTRLRELGWRTVYVFSGEPDVLFRQKLEELQSPYFVTSFPLHGRDAFRLACQLRPYHPTVVQVAFVSKFSPIWPWLKWRCGARRLVIVDHSSGSVGPRGPIWRTFARLRGWLASKCVDQVVAVSEFVAKRDINDTFITSSKVRTIHYGIDVERFGRVHVSDNNSTATGELLIAYAGQLIPEKGVLTLLRAIGHLATTYPRRIRIQIAGAGHQEADLKQYCKVHALADRVDFLGQIDWIPRLFGSADVVVIPSEWEEAFGLVVTEAMACGACVLASDAGGIPEVLGANGKSGVFFRAGDAEELAEKLRGLLDAPARRMALGQAARKRVRDRFTIKRMVDEYVSLYEKIAGDSR